VRAREKEGIEDDGYSGTWVRRGRERESERDRARERERMCVVCAWDKESESAHARTILAIPEF